MEVATGIASAVPGMRDMLGILEVPEAELVTVDPGI